MLRYRFALLAALAVPALVACTATSTTSGTGDPTTTPTDPVDPADPVKPADPKDPVDPVKPADPVKVTFAYSSVPLPGASLKIGAVGGSSSNDVWIIGADSAATQKDPWNAYHYDGTKWTTQSLTGVATGRPSFGVASTGPGSVYLGFSYSGDVFQLAGTSMTKVASFSVTSGYSMAAIGTSVFVGTQENFGAGPLYKIANGKSSQLAVPAGADGVQGIWGPTEDDVWVARSKGLGHLVNGKYEASDSGEYSDVHGTAKDDVWAVGGVGVKHYDGTAWKSVTFPSGSSRYEQPSAVVALSKDEVLVTTGDGKVYAWDGTAFALDKRTGAATSAGHVARIGKDEAWLVGTKDIARLAPEKK